MARPRQSWWQVAKSRSLGVTWTWLPPQSSLPPQKHAYVHDTHMISHSHRCVSTRASQAWRCAAAGHISSMAWAAEHWAARFALVPDWLQFVSRCGGLGSARTGSPISTSFIACIHRGERGRISVSRGTLGLTVGGPIDRVSTVRVLWAMLWRQGGRGRAFSLVDATVRC